MTPTQIATLFATVWQEDVEIEFVELARQGIPASMQGDTGPFVADYLSRLFTANKRALLHRASDQFLGLFP